MSVLKLEQHDLRKDDFVLISRINSQGVIS
jgi:hypothetical protein